ncbi:SRPBCC family protein [Massilia sp. TN1-12]|uniref:SRPBCC family protein n=1 Tax=Massilia paldalensis TaxID=3377675 RepID=UPI00384BE654
MRPTSDINLDIAKWLGGAAAGALLMYMLDPDRGGARRARSAAAVRGAGTRTSQALGHAWHGAGERLGAAGERLRGTVRQAAADVREAVRPDGAGGRLLDGAGARMAHDAQHGMERIGDATGAPDRSNGAWSPAVRNSAVAGGTLLATVGVLRRSPLALVLGLAGAALLARGAANRPLGGALGGALGGMMRGQLGQRLRLSMDQTADVEQSIRIDAAPEDVYDLWTDYENFPRFMSHVVEVRDLGRRRSHWVVKGPGGTEFAWNSVVTEQSRPHRLAWRSEPGAEIPQNGSVQFEPQDGGTLVTVRMSYVPPAGALGRGLAALLGADPQARMQDDLRRMKSFIERGAAPFRMADRHPGGRTLH